MSSTTFDIFSVKSVPSDYSWDKGTPTQDFFDFVTELSACSAISTNDQKVEYVGYAPFMFVSLSSTPGEISDTHLALRRTADFGDFYNSESNFVTFPTLSDELFCHVYVMPGLYTVRLERTEYIEAAEEAFTAYGACLQKHCIDWSWKTLSNCTPELSVTWSSTLTGNAWTKKWKFEPCEENWASSNGLYIQQIQKEEEANPLSWQWYNFVCPTNSTADTECYLALQEDSITPVADQENRDPLLVDCVGIPITFTSPHNTPTKWSATEFQQPEQLTWAGTSGPCLDLGQTEQTTWRWNNITITPGQYNTVVTWNDTICSSPTNATWDHVKDNCVGSSAPMISSSTRTIVKEALIRVLEIPPVAYLEAIQPPNRTSPLTVRLSPASTICGSFPIEKIVWDLGDGSPLLTQRRWANTLEDPFIFSGTLSEDYQDPRNYDVVHTYIKTPDTGYCFYPSITAFCSSTNSSDCASVMVGPLKLPTTNGSNFTLLQNELTNYGKVYIGQVDENVAVWRADK